MCGRECSNSLNHVPKADPQPHMVYSEPYHGPVVSHAAPSPCAAACVPLRRRRRWQQQRSKPKALGHQTNFLEVQVSSISAQAVRPPEISSKLLFPCPSPSSDPQNPFEPFSRFIFARVPRSKGQARAASLAAQAQQQGRRNACTQSARRSLKH